MIGDSDDALVSVTHTITGDGWERGHWGRGRLDTVGKAGIIPAQLQNLIRISFPADAFLDIICFPHICTAQIYLLFK